MPEVVRDGVTCVFCSEPGSKKCGKCHSVTYCSAECQRQDWARHKRLCVPVVIAQVPGKGRGLVASKDIKAGQLVLRDKIVVTWPRSNMASEDYLLQQIDALPEIDKAAFWQLTCRDEYGDKSFQQAIGIMQNNALQYNTTRNNVDLLLNLSLINNSCSPNCVAAPVLNSLNIRDVVAFQDIKVGEEITLCYETSNMYHNKKYRQDWIKNYWDFECICSRCGVGDLREEEELKASLDQLKIMSKSMFESSWMLNSKKWEKMANVADKQIGLLNNVSYGFLQLPFESASLVKFGQLGMAYETCNWMKNFILLAFSYY